MRSNAIKIMITGLPGTGKTTLIRKLAGELAHMHPVGFFTAEIREKGARKGFELIDLTGQPRRLAHIDIKGPYRVGKYGVDIEGFEKYLEEVDLVACHNALLIIDEIGKMECLSKKFIALINSILESDRSVIATVALRGDGLIAQAKKRRDVKLFEISLQNRDSMAAKILRYFGSAT